MAMGIESFDHFGVATDDFERTCALYENVLGLKRIDPPAIGPNFTLAWFTDEHGNQVHINERDENFAPPGTFNRAVINHAAFEVKSLAEAKVELEKAGFSYWETPQGEGVLHRRQLYVTDEPSGLFLELFENIKDVEPA
jgi:catechol 2,3-dioxygenase-like lactoylglutathione lyase family enzyme